MSSFPEAKIIARGEEILIRGSSTEVTHIEAVVRALVAHHARRGEIHDEDVLHYLNEIQTGTEIVPLGASKDDIIIHATGGKPIFVKSKHQRLLFDSIKKNDLVFTIGPSGTGKTYLTVAIALRALRNQEVQRIIITRPAVETGENLGFLPGDLKEKMDPYLQPVHDALRSMLSKEKLHFFKENGLIEIAPLAYMRGRTLSNAFVILDEAQNATTTQLKMFLTRLDVNTKAVITGDISQIDLPNRKQSGLESTITLLKKIPGIGIVELQPADIMRHPLIKHILAAYSAQKDKNST